MIESQDETTGSGVADLRAPFPWFGGKSRASDIIWSRFGDVSNYVECFAGSLAVLLMRPHAPRIETVNDLDCYLANFWRALQHDPKEVARWADSPVNEADLSARHLWLVNRDEFRESMKTDPDYFDPKIAGWWVWGLCSWIGRGWCDAGRGVNRKLPDLYAGRGVNRQLPHLYAGQGVNRQLLHLGDAGRGERLEAYFAGLAARLARVRVCCGEWDRVLSPTPTFKQGMTGVLLDPPYGDDAILDRRMYCQYSGTVAGKVREWAIENGGNPLLRIAFCGYEGEHAMPADWECVAWKAGGGYSSKGGTGDANRKRERIWFSPACLKVVKQGLLSLA